MWAQKARSDWIIKGDKNTRYFQTVVKQRRARSRILHFTTKEGNATEDWEEMESTLGQHFRSQYIETDSKPIPTLMEKLAGLPIPRIDQH